MCTNIWDRLSSMQQYRFHGYVSVSTRLTCTAPFLTFIILLTSVIPCVGVRHCQMWQICLIGVTHASSISISGEVWPLWRTKRLARLIHYFTCWLTINGHPPNPRGKLHLSFTRFMIDCTVPFVRCFLLFDQICSAYNYVISFVATAIDNLHCILLASISPLGWPPSAYT